MRRSSRLRMVVAIAVVILGVPGAYRAAVSAQSGGWQFENVAFVDLTGPCLDWHVGVSGLAVDQSGRLVTSWWQATQCGGQPTPFWARQNADSSWTVQQITSPGNYRAMGVRPLALAPAGSPLGGGTPFLVYEDTVLFEPRYWGYYVANLDTNPAGNAYQEMGPGGWYFPGSGCRYSDAALRIAPASATATVLARYSFCSSEMTTLGITTPGASQGKELIGTDYYRSFDLALGPHGEQHIVYGKGYGLGAFYRTGATQPEILLMGDVSPGTSVEADANNHPHIALSGVPYCGGSGILYMTSSDTAHWSKEFVDTVGGGAIQLSPSGVPFVVYWRDNTHLRLAQRQPNGTWASVPVYTGDTKNTPNAALAFDASGNPLVAFYNGQAKYVQVASGGPANLAPELANVGTQTFTPGQSVSLQVTATDPEGQPLTYTLTPSGLVNDPPTCPVTGLSIDPKTGLITGIIPAGATGSSYTLTVTATDGSDNATLATFSVTIAENHAPTVTDPGAQSSLEGSAPSISISASDPDSDPLTFTATGLPPGLAIDATTGLISGTLPFTAAGSYSVSVTVNDGKGGSASTTFPWTVTDVNQVPTITNPGPQVSDEGGAPTLAIAASDPDTDALTFSATGLPPGLSINSATGVISGGPLSYTAAGDYSVTVAVNDGKGGTASATFAWKVNNVNRPPVITNPGPQVSDEGGAPTLAIAASDADGDALTFSATGLPPGLSINSATGVIAGSLPYVSAGTYPVTVTVNDGKGGTASTAFTWKVNAVIRNHAPVCSAAVPSITEIWPPDHKKTFPISISNVTDPDGDPTVVTIAAVLQDEPTNTLGDATTWIDGGGVGTSAAWVRAERAGTQQVPGNGRVYEIRFSAADGKGGTCAGAVFVTVPHDRAKPAIDDLVRYDSTVAGGARVR